MKNYLLNVQKIGGSHFQCVNKHYAKFEYKVMNTVGVTDYTNYASPKHYGWKKKSEFNTRQKNKKKLKELKIKGEHLQCVNNHYAKFEYKGMKTVGVSDFTN